MTNIYVFVFILRNEIYSKGKFAETGFSLFYLMKHLNIFNINVLLQLKDY